MHCILSKNNDVFFNLASEEYFVKNSGEEIFMLWQSMNSVVVGKHQNTLSEIDYRFVNENNIQVARRLSGGGAVFHGPGNINFTFIRNGEPGKLVDFNRFILPVIEFLGGLGIGLKPGLKNEILLEGKKISGNAEHVYKNRVLHHGTLLFDADLDNLRNSIQTIPGKYRDKAVQSNRGSIVNISECIIPAMTRDDFVQAFFENIREKFGGVVYDFDDSENKQILELRSSKYITWEWIYGWSPAYEMKQVLNAKIPMEIRLTVRKGIILNCILQSPSYADKRLEQAANAMTGCRHEFHEIVRTIEKASLHKILDTGLLETAYAFF